MTSIKLVDAQEMHRQYPETFEVPSDSDLDSIKAGDFVKAGFIDASPGGERMWLRVVSVDGDSITGILDNYPTESSVKYGDSIVLERRHVCALMD